MAMNKHVRPSSVPANPEQWSEKSKQSVAYDFRREYRDIAYQCWHCKADCIYTAQDQQHAFEVKKVNINQRHVLRTACWHELNRIHDALRDCEAQWAARKLELQADQSFLNRWSSLLVASEAYGRHRPDRAKKNMLAKLLSNS